MLSTRTYVSTTTENYFKNHREIGKVQTGTVYELTGTAHVLKVAYEGRSDQVWNDSRMHKLVEESFQKASIMSRQERNMPTFGDWVSPTHNVWKQNVPLFPRQMKADIALLTRSRIYPFPRLVREAIVDAFAPRDIKSQKTAFLLAQEANNDCLIRIYVGRRIKRTGTSFTMRNFDMTINEMEVLRLDTVLYAQTMAESLAILEPDTWKSAQS